MGEQKQSQPGSQAEDPGESCSYIKSEVCLKLKKHPKKMVGYGFPFCAFMPDPEETQLLGFDLEY